MAYDAKREPTPRSKSQVNSEDTPPELVMTRTRSSHVFKKRSVATEVTPEHPFGWQATQRRTSRPKIDENAIGGEAIPPGSPKWQGRSSDNNSRSSSAGSRGDPTMPTSGEPPCLDTDEVEMLLVYKCLFGALDLTSIGGDVLPDSPRCGSSPGAYSRSSSFGCRGDPTIPNIHEFPPSLDTSSVEKEHQQALKSAVRRVSNGAKRGEPVFQDSPLSPPSGRTVQNEINGPFCYATGLEPVQEFMGNLSYSESSMLSSYPSYEEKKKYLNSLSSFEEKPKLAESFSSFGEHCVLGALD